MRGATIKIVYYQVYNSLPTVPILSISYKPNEVWGIKILHILYTQFLDQQKR